MSLPTWGGNGNGGGALTVPSNLIFANDTARDAYFTANPAQLSQNLFCSSNNVLEQYVNTSWVNMGVAIVGAQGAQGIQGIQGLQGAQGIQGVAGQSVSVQYSPDGSSGWTTTINTAIHYFWRWSIDGGNSWTPPVRFQYSSANITVATSSATGVVKVGNGLNVDGTGNLTVNPTQVDATQLLNIGNITTGGYVGTINFAGSLSQFANAIKNSTWEAATAGSIGGLTFNVGDELICTATISGTPANLSTSFTVRPNALPVATSTQNGIVSPDGTVITNSSGAITVPPASYSGKGVVSVDSSTLSVDANGKLSSKIGAATYYVVSSQANMLALPKIANLSICTRTDNQHIYYLNANTDPSILANWTDGGSTVGAVQSFNTRTGAILPAAGDYNAYLAAFNSTKSYSNGECCLYNGAAYYANTAVTPAAWTPSQWTLITPAGSTSVAGILQISTSTPLIDGTATAGNSGKVSDARHVHPTDTSRAPLSSPVFTGNPTAPTPASGDNSTSVSTTAFVASAISNLAPVASPVFTGNPKSVTQPINDNSTNIATTAYADRVGTIVMSAASSGAAGTAGIVPAPAKGSQALFLRGDATWASPPTAATMIGANSGNAGSSGMVPAPLAANYTSFLRGDATWQYPSSLYNSAGNLLAFGSNGDGYFYGRTFYLAGSNTTNYISTDTTSTYVAGGSSYAQLQSSGIALFGGSISLNAGATNDVTVKAYNKFMGFTDGANSGYALTSANGYTKLLANEASNGNTFIIYSGLSGGTTSQADQTSVRMWCHQTQTSLELNCKAPTVGNQMWSRFFCLPGTFAWNLSNYQVLNMTSAYAYFAINVLPQTDNTYTLGTISNRWQAVYATNSVIQTSDERFKSNINDIDDKMIDVWGSYNPWKQYVWTDSLDKKGDKARLSFGITAQTTEKKFADAGIDIKSTKLLQYDVWEDSEVDEPNPNFDREKGESEDNPSIIKRVLPAGDRYSVAYNNAFALEAAYMRKRADKLESENAELKARLDKIEALLAK